MRPPELPLAFLLQRLGDEQPTATAHLDLSCDDRDAETARQQALGADVVRRTHGWTVMRDPAGRRYCNTGRRAGRGLMEVRDATGEDWPAIWPIVEATVRAGETYAYDRDLTSEQARSLWLATPPAATVVAVDDGEVLGTARMGPNRDGPGSHVGTASFMVGAAGPRPRRGADAGDVRRRLAPRARLPRHPVQRRRGDQHRGGGAVALARLHGRRHRAGRVPPPHQGYVGLHVMFLPLV